MLTVADLRWLLLREQVSNGPSGGQIMLVPVKWPLPYALLGPGQRTSTVQYSSDYILYCTGSCHTHGDNLVKSGGCTVLAILNTQDSDRKNRGLAPNPSQCIICYCTVLYRTSLGAASPCDRHTDRHTTKLREIGRMYR